MLDQSQILNYQNSKEGQFELWKDKEAILMQHQVLPKCCYKVHVKNAVASSMHQASLYQYLGMIRKKKMTNPVRMASKLNRQTKYMDSRYESGLRGTYIFASRARSQANFSKDLWLEHENILPIYFLLNNYWTFFIIHFSKQFMQKLHSHSNRYFCIFVTKQKQPCSVDV